MATLAIAACSGQPRERPTRSGVESAAPARGVPRPSGRLPDGPLGASIRRGQALLLHTRDSLPRFAPSKLRCVSCHLDTAQRLNAIPLVGVHARFPRYIDRAGSVVTLEDRVNFCFTRSLAGRAIPTDGRDMHDIVAYLAFISTGIPVYGHVPGEGLAAMPRLVGDTTRGAHLFATTCVVCHGATGGGAVAPPLWGAHSFSMGASTAREERMASFVRHNMPFDRPGTLTDQQAYDVAAYVVSHGRPDFPGKEHDWPHGDAPYDVPYNTAGHRAYRPPPPMR